jgi:hypothetical protein
MSGNLRNSKTGQEEALKMRHSNAVLALRKLKKTNDYRFKDQQARTHDFDVYFTRAGEKKFRCQ